MTTTTTKFSSILDLDTTDEVYRGELDRAIIELAEILYSEPLLPGQSEQVADEMRDLQSMLDDLDRYAPGWQWLCRISTMEEAPEGGTTYTRDGIDWDLS